MSQTPSLEHKSLPWGRVFWALLFVGLLLRLWNAWSSSLWLDDFHSLYHAGAPDMQRFFSGLLKDNHPPLSFLLLRLARALLGSSDWVMHVPNLLIALLGAGLLWRLAQRVDPGSPKRRGAAQGALLFLAFSALHVELSSNLRMYALLGLCVLGLLAALIDQFESGKGSWRIVLWLVLGLHTHYHFLHAALLLGCVSLGLVYGASLYRHRLRSILLSFSIGLCLSAPWFLLGFRVQLAHGLAPGGSSVSPTQLAMGLLHLLHQGAGEHGPVGRALLLAGGAAAFVLAGIGLLQLCLRAKSSGRPASVILLASAAFLLPLWTAVAAALSARSGFESRYLAGALAPMALLAGLGGFGSLLGPRALTWPRRLAAGYALLAALLLSLQLAASSGHEDYRSATAFILGEAQAGDAILAADWQPSLFPHGIGWEHYASRLAAPDAAPLPRLDHDADFNLLQPERLSLYARVHCLLRSIPRNAPLLRKLRSFYGKERTQSFGRGIFVLSFSQPKPR